MTRGELLEKAKTKRYPMARLRRMLLPSSAGRESTTLLSKWAQYGHFITTSILSKLKSKFVNIIT